MSSEPEEAAWAAYTRVLEACRAGRASTEAVTAARLGYDRLVEEREARSVRRWLAESRAERREWGGGTGSGGSSAGGLRRVVRGSEGGSSSEGAGRPTDSTAASDRPRGCTTRRKIFNWGAE
jgi:hypothetical protein